MDPVTQGVLGAVLPQAVASKKQLLGAVVIGGLAGMTPDLDVLIRSSQDPLLFLEYHRQFTHSLLFIPIGGVLCGLLLHWLIGRRLALSLASSLLFAMLGFATHALLDACTTYGTQLLWPLSNQRFAWNTISIIDPLFTLPLLGLLIAGLVKRSPKWPRIALVWGLCYLCLGALQRERAETVGWQLAASRNHQPLRLEAKPSFGNLWLWKVVYDTADFYYVDAVRVLNNSRSYAGERLQKLDVARDFPTLDSNSQQARDIERFRWFSNDYLAIDKVHLNQIIDVRYSLVPNQIAPLWGIEINVQASAKDHVVYFVNQRADKAQRERFWRMLIGADEDNSSSR